MGARGAKRRNGAEWGIEAVGDLFPGNQTNGLALFRPHWGIESCEAEIPNPSSLREHGLSDE